MFLDRNQCIVLHYVFTVCLAGSGGDSLFFTQRASCCGNVYIYIQCIVLLSLSVKRPVKTEQWGAGVVICLVRDADLHMAQLMPLPLTVSCFSKIQIGFIFLVPAHPGSPGKGPLNGCVCVLLSGCVAMHSIRLGLLLVATGIACSVCLSVGHNCDLC